MIHAVVRIIYAQEKKGIKARDVKNDRYDRLGSVIWGILQLKGNEYMTQSDIYVRNNQIIK